jgi:VCBS repeat-containing protein
MLTTRFTRHLAGRRGPRGGARKRRSARSRSLHVERLEQRQLLAADFAGWQNLLVPTDVNNDGYVSPMDILLVAHELYKNGAHVLAAPAVASGHLLAATAMAGESTASGGAYLDVNGDNYVTSQDALIVAHHLRSADATDQVVGFRFEITTLSGDAVADGDVFVGDTIQLNVYVQDIRRDDLGLDLGVYSAYLDVTFDSALATALGPITFGDEFTEQTSGDLAAAGLIDEAGAGQDLGLGALGAGEYLLFSVSLQATAAGTVIFEGQQADLAVAVVTDDAGGHVTVASDDVFYGDALSLTINSAPAVVANPDDYDGLNAVDEDSGATALDVLDNDDCGTSGTLGITAVGDTSNGGEVTIENDGTRDYLLYTPALDFFGTETFTYTIDDGLGLGHTAEATVSVTVNNLNDAPVANPDPDAGNAAEFTTVKDTVLTTGDVLANDTDADGDLLYVDSYDTTSAKGGLVTYNDDGTFDYNPNGKFDALAYGEQTTDTFTYTVADGNGESATATVTITITGGQAVGTVLFALAVTDLDGNVITSASQGESFLLNVFVQDIRTGTVPDPGVYAAYADVTFDDALIAAVGSVNHSAYYDEETSGSVSAALINEAGGIQHDFGMGSDPGGLGAGQFLVFSVQFQATNVGTVTFRSDPADDLVFHSVLTFEPTGTVPVDDIVYGVTQLTIDAGPVVAVDDAYPVNEDIGNTQLNVLDNDEINTAGALTITAVGSTDHGGTVTVVRPGGGVQDYLLYRPAANFHGTETFTYTIGDGLGHTDEATVVMTVGSVNDDPVANPDPGAGSAAAFTTDKNTAFTTGNVLTNDTDADGDTLLVSGYDTTSAKGGLVTYNVGAGTFNYNPNGKFASLVVGQQTTDTFTYTVSDGNGGTSTTTVTITVTGPQPVASPVVGYVFADADDDGVFDSGERAIGGVVIQLAGTDMLGAAVSRTTVSDAQGRYGFTGVIAGSYTLIESQPRFFIDGKDTVNGVLTSTSDRATIAPGADLANLRVNFGERSLDPHFISVADYTNPLLRQGIVFGLDASGHQLWYSLLDGWTGVTAVSMVLSSNGSTATVTVTKGSAGSATFTVSTAPANLQYRVKGTMSGQGSVVQVIGTMAGLVTQGFSSSSAGAADGGTDDADSIDAVMAGLEDDAFTAV